MKARNKRNKRKKERKKERKERKREGKGKKGFTVRAQTSYNEVPKKIIMTHTEVL